MSHCRIKDKFSLIFSKFSQIALVAGRLRQFCENFENTRANLSLILRGLNAITYTKPCFFFFRDSCLLLGWLLKASFFTTHSYVWPFYVVYIFKTHSWMNEFWALPRCKNLWPDDVKQRKQNILKQ